MRKRLTGMLLLMLAVLLLCAGSVQADFVKQDGAVMYQAEDGSFLTGLQEIGGKLYYFGSDYKLRKGKLKDASGNLYITNSKGVIYRDRFFKYKKKYYYANTDGRLATGAQLIDGSYYCFKSNGKMVRKALYKIGEDSYYLLKNGKAVCEKWVKIKKKYYYFLADGKMARNMYIGTKWFVGEDGVRVKSSSIKPGVKKVNGKIYLTDALGNYLTSQWVTVDEDTYYVGADGAALTGAQVIDSKQYYFDSDGVLQRDTVVMINNKAYTVDKNGVIVGTTVSLGKTIAKYAKQFVGNPYVWGGVSLKTGADCSGFVYAIYKEFGIQLMRVADDQMDGPSAAYQKLGYKKGTVIKDEDLSYGDLVFYGTSSYASHVAMYIGKGKVVHAANSRLGTIISTLDYVNNRIKDRNMRYWA